MEKWADRTSGHQQRQRERERDWERDS